MNNTMRFKLILVTPIFILLSHYLAVFPHEYAHSFMAWLLGYKNNPFALNYGGANLHNLLLLSQIDENVHYRMIYSLGHKFHVALIAFAGSGLANASLFVLSLLLLAKKSIKKRPYLFYFLFWFNLMNLGNFYDYVPIRTFATHGDMTVIEIGLNISPWWIYIIFGYLVAFLIHHFFTRTLIQMFVTLGVATAAFRASLMIICVCILFGFFGGIIGVLISPVSMPYGEISYFLSVTSFLSIPGIIMAAWPTRAWVVRQVKMFEHNAN